MRKAINKKAPNKSGLNKKYCDYNEVPILNLMFTNIFEKPILPSSNLEMLAEGPIAKALKPHPSIIF